MKKNTQKVLLSSIQSLTFFAEEYTRAKRAEPIPQLTCIGKICNIYQPEAVQCTNIGGKGTAVNWKCEADLPSTLRFGKVTVSCEGWDAPGDDYVLEGSCGLEYRLTHIPDSFQPSVDKLPNRGLGGLLGKIFPNDTFGQLFMIVWLALLGYFGYLIYKSCVEAYQDGNGPPRPGGGTAPRGRRPDGGGSSGGTHYPGPDAAPPPYSPSAKNNASSQNGTSGAWTPGFWSGLSLGALGASIGSVWRSGRENARRLNAGEQAQWDWERARARDAGYVPRGFGYGGNDAFYEQPRRRVVVEQNAPRTQSDGAGSSGLGQVRRSTALGSSQVR